MTPFGNDILYYDGMTLYCLRSNGYEKWSYPLGENASFSCSDSVVAAWSGTQLHIIDRDGNSTFEIPVILDKEMPVSASTIAMSQPHLIDYTLYFDGSTLINKK